MFIWSYLNIHLRLNYIHKVREVYSTDSFVFPFSGHSSYESSVAARKKYSLRTAKYVYFCVSRYIKRIPFLYRWTTRLRVDRSEKECVIERLGLVYGFEMGLPLWWFGLTQKWKVVIINLKWIYGLPVRICLLFCTMSAHGLVTERLEQLIRIFFFI